MQRLSILCLCAIVFLPSQQDSVSRNIRLAIVGGTLIDGTGASPIPDSLVLIDNGTITYAGKRESSPGFLPDTLVIDVTGKFVIPGLIDMHVHYEDWMGKLFLANGVTTVRDTGNDPEWITKERGRINASPGAAAPRIVACGPVIDGTDVIWEMYSSHIAKADDDPAARKIVRDLVALKVDCLKTYINLPSAAMQALIDEAHRHGMPVTGHLGHVDARQAALLGIDQIEHASGIAEAALTDAALERVRKTKSKHHSPTGENWPVQPWEFTSPERLRTLIRVLAGSRIAITPTLVVYDRIAHLNDPAILSDPDLKHMRFSSELKHLWVPENYFRIFGTKPWRRQEYRRAVEQQRLRMAFVREFANSGGVVVAGSDTPNPYVIPGFGLHRELQLLVKSGLTPMQALQASTLSAARAIRKEERLGSISAFKNADLVILNGDPLADIGQTSNIHSVLKNGIVHNPTALLN